MLKKGLIAGIVMVMCMTGSMLYGVAIGAEKDKATTYTAYEVSQVELFLNRKGKDYVLADDMRFKVNSSTVIKNGMGKDVTLEELQVRSKVIVEYYKESEKSDTYIAVSIQELLMPE